MVWTFIIFSILRVTGVFTDNGNPYLNHTLMQLIPTNTDHLQLLKHFSPESLTKHVHSINVNMTEADLINDFRSGHIDVFKNIRGDNDSLDLLVPEQYVPIIESYAEEHEFAISIKKVNYGNSFLQKKTLKDSNNILHKFNSYDTIQNIIKKLAFEHRDIMQLEYLGDSFEKRPMYLVKISINPKARNPIIFIDAGIHSREWMAPAMALYLINHLVTNPNARHSDLNGLDWYILPVVNPDGYEFTRSSPKNRLWRKTRSKRPTSECYGVDGNRNYGYKWGSIDVSKDPCEFQIYGGPHAFSEVETIYVQRIMLGYKDRIKLYVSMHAYGQYLVYPWGFTETLPEGWKNLYDLAQKVSKAVVSGGGPAFKTMSAGQWYPAAGGSDDYAYGTVGIPYVYTIELTDGHDFTFPEHLLGATLPKYIPGFQAFAKHIQAEFGRHNQQKKRFKKKSKKKENSIYDKYSLHKKLHEEYDFKAYDFEVEQQRIKNCSLT